MTISFDAGDPQDLVAWRLFLLAEDARRDVSLDQLGEELSTGFGNVGEFTMTTAKRVPGQYLLGVSATDNGASVAAAVAPQKVRNRRALTPDSPKVQGAIDGGRRREHDSALHLD